ncbi:MAG: metallophosphatase family protein, partial [Candidatus Omnitrophica bacterium]|nr:metallophosphatase family protein [Candidatus Omnitrophota bacterium]
MRWGIFSDVHSNLEALNAVAAAYKFENIDLLLCLGDIVGYAANPVECIQRVREISRVVVAGNHDWAAAGLLSLYYFNDWAKQAISWTKGKLSIPEHNFLKSLKPTYKNEELILVHGTLNSPEEFDYMSDTFQAAENFALMDRAVCFVGHTHKAGIFLQQQDGKIDYQREGLSQLREGCRYIIDVGSVGQPRDGNNKASFCIYDTTRQEVLIRRVSYDIEAAQAKILASGLPPFLATRLLAGK